MKRFDNFGEYMFDLLFAPLKKGKRAVNQFYIFFKVVGHEFDDVKTAFFRVRDEANVVSASSVMLPVHGQDRNMPRLIGEEMEAYRIRLSMKGIISEWGGTRQGLNYALTALGYKGAYVMPAYLRNPERWAEFYIVFPMDADDKYPVSVALLKQEIRRIKEGSSRDNYLFVINSVCTIDECFRCHRLINRITVNWYHNHVLNGDWYLDGNVTLDNTSTNHPMKIIYRVEAESIEEGFSQKVNVKYHYWTLDGNYPLDGERALDAEIYKEELE